MRQRTEDISILTQYFLKDMAGGASRNVTHVAPEVFALFRDYFWPGNIRELKNVLTFALYSLEENVSTLYPRHLPPQFNCPKCSLSADGHMMSLMEMQQHSLRSHIAEALRRCSGNKNKAALMLGISRSELYKKIQKLGMSASPQGNTGFDGRE